MKFVNRLLSMVLLGASYQASAASCMFPDYTDELKEMVGYQALLNVDPLKDLSETTYSENDMMKDAVNVSRPEVTSLAEGVGAFLDVPGYHNAGNIQYFKLENELYALAHYYPGDNEVGVIVKLQTSSEAKMRKADYEVVAVVSDAEIDCK